MIVYFARDINMKKTKYLLSIFYLLILGLQNTLSQVVESNYKKMSMEQKRLIIAPLSIGSIDSSFTEEYPEIQNPRDSLMHLIENDLPSRIRKYSPLRSMYFSTYKNTPVFSKRTLFLSSSASFEVSLPHDDEKLQMNLLGLKPTEPDFILYLQIDKIRYTESLIIDSNMKLEKREGIVLENVKYVFWDNKIGRIAAYNQSSILIEVGLEKFVGLLARYILTRTPFSSPDMPYFPS